MLNLKRLQYLDAVYQYKNFTQASEALYVSQPAISSAVQALEEELGVRLVVRSTKGVTFTYEGTGRSFDKVPHFIRPEQ